MNRLRLDDLGDLHFGTCRETSVRVMKVSSRGETSGDFVDATSADRWFAALDQRRVGVVLNSWVIQVHGVHCEQDGLWIQISSTDDPFATILLHLALTTPIEDVLAALERYNPPVDGRPAILDLTAWTAQVSINSAAASLMYPRRRQ